MRKSTKIVVTVLASVWLLAIVIPAFLIDHEIAWLIASVTALVVLITVTWSLKTRPSRKVEKELDREMDEARRKFIETISDTEKQNTWNWTGSSMERD